MKRTFGYVEVVFDIAYLLSVLTFSFLLFLMKDLTPVRIIAGSMSLVLVIGDAFHLIPRIMSILKGSSAKTQYFLGIGKQISSITMTVFYILLWHIGLHLFVVDNAIVWTVIFYVAAITRIVLCLLPQNKWKEKEPPFMWGIWRNIPFIIMGAMTVIVFLINQSVVLSLQYVWLAVLLSFIFYLPVVIFAQKNAKVGMLMLPKSLMYVWLLVMFILI